MRLMPMPPEAARAVVMARRLRSRSVSKPGSSEPDPGSVKVLTISFHRVETSMDSNCSVAFRSFSSCDGPASLGALGLVALSGAVTEFDRASAESVESPMVLYFRSVPSGVLWNLFIISRSPCSKQEREMLNNSQLSVQCAGSLDRLQDCHDIARGCANTLHTIDQVFHRGALRQFQAFCRVFLILNGRLWHHHRLASGESRRLRHLILRGDRNSQIAVHHGNSADRDIAAHHNGSRTFIHHDFRARINGNGQVFDSGKELRYTLSPHGGDRYIYATAIDSRRYILAHGLIDGGGNVLRGGKIGLAQEQRKRLHLAQIHWHRALHNRPSGNAA